MTPSASGFEAWLRTTDLHLQGDAAIIAKSAFLAGQTEGAARERERCALLVEDYMNRLDRNSDAGIDQPSNAVVLEEVADALRTPPTPGETG